MFIEIINTKKANIVVMFYKHPNIDDLEFNNHLNLEKVSREQNQIFFLGDFNINLLNYNVHQPTNDFVSLASNSIIPYILQPKDLKATQKLSLTTFLIIYFNFYLPLIFFQTLLIIDQIFLKETGQNLIKKTSY